MGHLDNLTISNRIIDAAKRRKKIETVEYRRDKLVANIEEQIELANLALRDEPLVLKRKRGHSVATVRPRIWWVTESEGQIFTQIRYNKIPMKLAGKGTTIQVGPLRKLPKVYKTVIRAIENGELDQSIENAAKKSHP